MSALSSKIFKLSLKQPAESSGGIAIIGFSTIGAALKKKLSKVSSDVAIYEDDETVFEGSDHHYLLLQNFVKQANRDFHDQKLSQYFGWQNVPPLVDQASITKLYNAQVEEHKSNIETMSKGKKPLSDLKANSNHEYVFVCKLTKLEKKLPKSIEEIFGAKLQLDAHQFAKIPPNSKSVIVYSSSAHGLEFSLFLAQSLNTKCVVVIPDQLQSKMNAELSELFDKYLAAQGVIVVPEQNFEAKNFKEGEDIPQLIENAECAIYYPSFENAMSEDLRNLLENDLKAMESQASKLSCSPDFDGQATFASKIAFSLLKGQKSQISLENNLAHMFKIKTPLEFCSIGKQEDELQALDQSTLVRYSFSGSVLEHATSFGELEGSQILLTTNKEKDEILNIQILAPNATKIASSLMLMFEYKLKFGDLDQNIGIHPTFAENLFSNLKEGINFGASASCST